MKAAHSYSDRVADYIYYEYDLDILVKLMTPEYADVIFSILHLHEMNNISVQETAVNIVNFIRNDQKK
jgi:hypothetical protein